MQKENFPLQSSQAAGVLAYLYADSQKTDALVRASLPELPAGATAKERFQTRSNLYMPVPPQFGNLLYGLAKANSAKTIVEFGTSFGISTIFLAAALADQGRGTVITTEFIPEKAAKAKENLTAAGLLPHVDFRIGDALESLKKIDTEIDFVLLDGEKSLYIDVLKLIEPKLRKGAVIASDNTDHDGIEGFLAYVRDPKNGYISSAILTPYGTTGRAHEISVRK